MGHCEHAGPAMRRIERRLRQFLRHERPTVAMVLSEKLHHTSRGQSKDRTGEEYVTYSSAKFRKTPPQHADTATQTDFQGAITQEHDTEHIMEHTVEATVPTAMGTPTLADSYAAIDPVFEYGTSLPAYATPSTLKENMVPIPTVTCAAPALVIEYGETAPAHTYTCPSDHIGRLLRGTSDRVYVYVTFRCLCSAYAGDRIRGLPSSRRRLLM